MFSSLKNSANEALAMQCHSLCLDPIAFHWKENTYVSPEQKSTQVGFEPRSSEH